MEFKLKNITLRTVVVDDLKEVARIWNFEKGEITLEEAKEAIEWMNKNHKLNQLHKIEHLCFAIFENNTRKIIGWCGLDGRYENTVKIFYLIDKDYRRRGYATECSKKLLEYGFLNMEVERIEGECAIDNIGSQKVLEKLKMKKVINEQKKESHHYFMTYKDYINLY
ncbi:GNAT family N-acetyltransferase [Mycoplasmatota bacterium]|nr:GNAT family N-acetyltransferase [Mycoplasmatota bacterium]